MLRKSDVLVVCKPACLARSLRNLVEVVQDLHDRGVDFKSLMKSIDTASSGGCLAEFERDLIRERTMAEL